MQPRAPSLAGLRSLDPPRLAAFVQGAAALLWLPQAALLAWAVEGLAAGTGLAAVLWPAGGIVLLGLLRVVCEAWGRAASLPARERRCRNCAHGSLPHWRHVRRWTVRVRPRGSRPA